MMTTNATMTDSLVDAEDLTLTEFLDDYFAESEEHLASIRRSLLVMEGFVRGNTTPSGVHDVDDVIAEMFHALHSLKGLSAMVGVREAEQAAHEMEASLRDMKQAGAGPTEAFMEILSIGVTRIEEIIAARRDRKSKSGTVVAGLKDSGLAAPSSVVRVDMRRLDDLMDMVGDLVISRGHVEESLRQLDAILPASAWRGLQEGNIQLQRQLRSLREGVLRARMVPVGQIFERMRFAIRGLERESRKEIRVEWSGQETEIDKHLVEHMMDPLLHMVRNAIMHGLESPEERIAAGKTRECLLRIRASTEAETVVMELEDDGRGVHIEHIAKRARVLGLIGPEEDLDPARLLLTICAPGFSIREEADLGAGRGVGMTVVKTTVHGLGGTIGMETLPGKGTKFIIRLPLTLAILQALIVYVDDQPFAVPRSAIHEVVRIENEAVTMEDGGEVIPYRGGVLPIVRLDRLFGMKRKSGSSFHVFVASAGVGGSIGIAVDRIAGQREIVVRHVEDSLARVPGIAGATELGNGRPVLIVDVAAIVDAGLSHSVSLAVEVGAAVTLSDARPHPAEGDSPSRQLARPGPESFVLFELAGSICGVRCESVQSVETVEHVTAVPNAPSFVEGVTLTGGRVIPVINLRSCFGFPRMETGPGGRMLVVCSKAGRSKARIVGMLVDGVREFVSIHADGIQRPSPQGQPAEEPVSDFTRCVDGAATIGNRNVLILNLEKIIEET